MNEISFPEIGLKMHISKIAFSIGKIDIYWYAVLITISIIIAIIGIKKDCKIYNINYNDILKFITKLIIISFISARLYYVLFEIKYYSKHILEIFNIRNGGLAIYGGIIGGVITIIIFCKKNKIKILDMLDMIVPYLAIGQSIGRWGNFFNIEAYGVETQNIFRMKILENGKYIEVHPTFLYESICTFIIFLILIYLKKHRKYSGQLTYIYLLLYSFARALIEGIRTDSLMIGEYRISQIVSIILFITTLIIITVKKYKLNLKFHK